jgi:hypothetical protein
MSFSRTELIADLRCSLKYRQVLNINANYSLIYITTNMIIYFIIVSNVVRSKHVVLLQWIKKSTFQYYFLFNVGILKRNSSNIKWAGSEKYLSLLSVWWRSRDEDDETS